MGIGFGTLAPALLWLLVADIISSIADLSQEVVCVKAPEGVKSINVKLHSSEFKRADFYTIWTILYIVIMCTYWVFCPRFSENLPSHIQYLPDTTQPSD